MECPCCEAKSCCIVKYIRPLRIAVSLEEMDIFTLFAVFSKAHEA